MVLNQKSARELLEENGWAMTRGGKHVVKMTEAGERPITLPHHKNRDYLPGLTNAILPSGRSQMTASTQGSQNAMEYTARIHHEEGTYWAEVPELPGVFATGDTVDELLEGLKEAVALSLGDGDAAATELSELKLTVPA